MPAYSGHYPYIKGDTMFKINFDLIYAHITRDSLMFWGTMINHVNDPVSVINPILSEYTYYNPFT